MCLSTGHRLRFAILLGHRVSVCGFKLEKNANSLLLPLCTAAAPWFVLPGHAVSPLWLCKSDAASQGAGNKLQVIQGKDMILAW